MERVVKTPHKQMLPLLTRANSGTIDVGLRLGVVAQSHKAKTMAGGRWHNHNHDQDNRNGQDGHCHLLPAHQEVNDNQRDQRQGASPGTGLEHIE